MSEAVPDKAPGQLPPLSTSLLLASRRGVASALAESYNAQNAPVERDEQSPVVVLEDTRRQMLTEVVKCPKCGKGGAKRDHLGGHTYACPHCKHAFRPDARPFNTKAAQEAVQPVRRTLSSRLSFVPVVEKKEPVQEAVAPPARPVRKSNFGPCSGADLAARMLTAMKLRK